MLINKLNIGDKIKIIRKGFIDHGVIAIVIGAYKFTDGKIRYTAEYNQKCKDGTEYKTSSQFEEGQYEIIKHNKN